jgi:hypothetical protein
MEINQGSPEEPGLYVAYVRSGFTTSYAEKMLLMNIDGRWGYPSSDQNYRGEVLGWIGPLPAMRINEE